MQPGKPAAQDRRFLRPRQNVETMRADGGDDAKISLLACWRGQRLFGQRNRADTGGVARLQGVAGRIVGHLPAR